MLILIGANQAELATSLQIDLAQTGLLTAMLSTGLGLGILTGGKLVGRSHRRTIFILFSAIISISLVSVEEVMSFQRTIAHIFFVGFGAGTCMTFLNTMASEHYHERAAKALAILHGSVTIGAITGPFAVRWILQEHPWSTSFHLTGLLIFFISLWAIFTNFPTPQHGHHDSNGDPQNTIRLFPAILPLAAIGMCYVGIETVVITFAIPFARDSLGQSILNGQAGISIYWVGILLGRLGILTLRGEFGSRALLLGGTVAIACCLGAFILHPLPIELITFAIGLSLGSTYPVLIAYTGYTFAHRRARAIALVSFCGSLGGFTIPWLTGTIGDAQGMSTAGVSMFIWFLILSSAAFIAHRAKLRRLATSLP
ncbi:MAG: MFS transporter [Deltaproteobacteria bacterium]|nr:MFS transporter [Deltaproteobacteria bacterium]